VISARDGRREGTLRNWLVKDDEPGHAGGRPLLEFGRLARNRNEGATRLLAGYDLGRAFGGDRGLKEVVGFETVDQHGRSW
jgi:hypothetical protein